MISSHVYYSRAEQCFIFENLKYDTYSKLPEIARIIYQMQNEFDNPYNYIIGHSEDRDYNVRN